MDKEANLWKHISNWYQNNGFGITATGMKEIMQSRYPEDVMRDIKEFERRYCRR